MNSPWMILSGLALSAMLLGCQTSQAVTTHKPQADDVTPQLPAQPPAQPAQAQAQSQSVTAESMGWQLAFHDTFNREAIGDNWKIIDGQWEMQEGLLRGSGTLISAHGFPLKPPAGYQRLEVEVSSDIRALNLFPGSKPKVIPSGMDTFIHAQSPEAVGKNPMMSGYFFQFGGQYNSINKVRHPGGTLWEQNDPTITIDPEKWHRIVVENDHGTLRFTVNNELVHEEKLTAITMGLGHDRVGLYFLTAVKIRDVKVYVKPLPNDLDVEF